MFDLVLITHIPSFYKINLYNEIAKTKKVAVIFLGSQSKIRTKDFMGTDFHFKAFFLYQGEFEQRPKLQSLWRCFSALRQLKAKRVVVGGWDCPEFWLSALMHTKKINAIACESSIYESNTTGKSAKIKKWFLKRFSLAFVSGAPHERLLRALGYNEQVRHTLGVGIFPLGERKQTSPQQAKRFLYIGRLSPEKNVAMLLHAFAFSPEFELTVVGKGPLAQQFIQEATDNIKFIEHVPNSEIGAVYQDHDCFILPSTKEPWGLVVEEAIHYGLPVIVSKTVGCSEDLVTKNHCGMTFDPHDVTSLVQALNRIQGQYQTLRQNCLQFSFAQRDAYQVQQYL